MAHYRQSEVIFPRVTSRTYPAHGDKVMDGRLGGQSTTDYFYFACPDCNWIMQAEPLKACLIEDGKGLVLHIGLYCSECHLKELVKIPAQTGWMGGYFQKMPLLDYTWSRTPKATDDAPQQTPGPLPGAEP